MRMISMMKQTMKINSPFVHFRPVAIKKKNITMIKTMGPKIRKKRSFFFLLFTTCLLMIPVNHKIQRKLWSEFQT